PETRVSDHRCFCFLLNKLFSFLSRLRLQRQKRGRRPKMGASRECLVEFIQVHKENVYRLAFSYVKDQKNALDIVQESIHKSLVSIHTLKSKQAIKSWFYRIVINTSLDYLRKHKRVQLMDDHMLEVHSPQVED